MRPHRRDAHARASRDPASGGGHRPSLRARSEVDETIEQIDRQIVEGFPLLTFGPALERRYVCDTFLQHKRSLIRIAAVALVLYDLFLLNDRRVLSDVFAHAVINRLIVFTPLAVVAIYVGATTTSPRILNVTFGATPVVSLLLSLLVVVDSASPQRTGCIYGALLVMMFSSVVQRIRFRYAVAAIASMLAALCAAMMRLGMLDRAILAGNLTLFVSAALLMIMASYLIEREERQGYLIGLRSRLLNQQLELSGRLDPLTGLWNRRVLTDAMDAECSATASASSVMALIIADVDQFKLFNDSYGHLAGDACLQRVADSLHAALPDDQRTVLARFGGEEFVIFAPGVDEHTAGALAEDLRAVLRSQAIAHPVLGPGAFVTASFGVAAARTPGVTASALLKAADEALYEAKRAGRDCVRLAGATSPPWTRSPGPDHDRSPDRASGSGGLADPANLAA